MEFNWTYTEVDRKIVEELQDFLPVKVFDAHAYIYRLADMVQKNPFLTSGPSEVTINVWREYMEKQFLKSHLSDGLFIPMIFIAEDPDGTGLDKMNAFLVEQIKPFPESRGLLLIGPQSFEVKLETQNTDVADAYEGEMWRRIDGRTVAKSVDSVMGIL